MQKHSVRSFQLPWYLLALLLILLVVLASLNAYQLLTRAGPSPQLYGQTQVGAEVQGGMGSFIVLVQGQGPFEVRTGLKFSAGASITFWDPIEELTFNFSFRLYGRSLQDAGYPDMPVNESFVVVNKSKDEMYAIAFSGYFTVTAPDTRGIHIYKMEADFSLNGIALPGPPYQVEFPMLVT
jgi:hypothetical protein